MQQTSSKFDMDNTRILRIDRVSGPASRAWGATVSVVVSERDGQLVTARSLAWEDVKASFDVNDAADRADWRFAEIVAEAIFGVRKGRPDCDRSTVRDIHNAITAVAGR